MPWLQLTIESTRDDAQRMGEALEEAGAVSVSFEGADTEPLFETDWHNTTPVWKQTRVVALFPEDTDTTAVMGVVAALLSLSTPPAFSSAPVADQDWVRVWMDRWLPMRFGANLWVVPSWLTPPDAGAANIILDPGMAFGTGTHATTAMCLEWLAAHPPRNLEVIDYGCGSGILAIAALKLGAAHALGTDTDPQALTVSHENAERNQVSERLALYLPGAVPAEACADVVLANILAGPLILLAPRLTTLVRPGGRLILSGLLANQVEEVEAAYAAHFVLERRVHDGWAMLAGQKIT
ncbi:MAG: 50S ribosomal protein L11 methyltransferase [Pseudomonadota bacterium]